MDIPISSCASPIPATRQGNSWNDKHGRCDKDERKGSQWPANNDCDKRQTWLTMTMMGRTTSRQRLPRWATTIPMVTHCQSQWATAMRKLIGQLHGSFAELHSNGDSPKMEVVVRHAKGTLLRNDWMTIKNERRYLVNEKCLWDMIIDIGSISMFQ